MNKLVLFGAGKIGRSFIGQLFARAGYEVVFIDINPLIIAELNQKRMYKVVIKADKEETIWIKNVRGVLMTDKSTVIKEVEEASLIAVSVGQRGLIDVIPVIAEGLIQRHNKGNIVPLDIIIAENLRNADQFMRQELLLCLPEQYPFDKLVGLVETSIGKMVPIMPKEEEEKDILQVFAEPYNTLILDKKGFRNKVPSVQGIEAKEHMKAWVDCKAYIHNFGHAVTAYIGHLYNPKFIFLYEALAEPAVEKFVKDAMMQSAAILMKKYPDDFTHEFIEYHVDDLVQRFKNRALGDTIFRVGCDLRRKLGKNDRIVSPLNDGISFHLPIDKIIFTLVCGYFFRAKDERGNLLKEDVDFINQLNQIGFKTMLNENSGIVDPSLEKLALEIYNNFSKYFKQVINY